MMEEEEKRIDFELIEHIRKSIHEYYNEHEIEGAYFKVDITIKTLYDDFVTVKTELIEKEVN